MSSGINIALPSIGREFSMDAVLLGWVLTSYLLAMAIFQVPFGRAADIYGRKRVFVLGMAAFTASSLLAVASPSSAALVALRFVQGMGAAMIFGTAVAILAVVFPPGERGRALGINVTAIYVALSMGPFIGGLLTHHLGWRSIFLVNVPLGLMTLGLIFWRLEGEWREAEGEAFDLTGFAAYGLSLSALMYGLSMQPSATGGAAAVLGAGGLLAFAVLESRSKSPLIDVGLFRKNRVFAFSNLAALINYCATFAVGFLLSLYLQYVKGFDPRGAGLVLVVQPMVQAVLSPYAGGLSDRIEPRLVASSGMAMTALGLLMFTFLGMETRLSYVILSLVVVGVGLAFFSSPNTNAVMGSVEGRQYGVASGIVATMRSTGMVMSMAIVMVAFSLSVGRVEIGPENHIQFVRSLRVVFSIMAVLCALGTVTSMARGKVR